MSNNEEEKGLKCSDWAYRKKRESVTRLESGSGIYGYA
jgi:hypothetical protein